MKLIIKTYQLIAFICKLNILKTIYYSLRFGGRVFVGKAKIYIEGNGEIAFTTSKSSIMIGVYTTVATPTVITLMNNAKLIVGHSVKINRGSKIVVHDNGILKIDDNTYFNENARVHCRKMISIGKNCAIAWNTNILDTDIHTIQYSKDKSNVDRNIQIGNSVWVGANSTILKGSTIEDNCIIGANSLVKGYLKSNNIYGGNPCQKTNTFESWSI